MPAKKAKETVVYEVDTDPIKALIDTAKGGLKKIWEPSAAIIESLRTDEIARTPSADAIAEMEDHLNPIYMIVPPDITKTWAKEYAKNNAELVEEVNNAYKERYARLESQHQVAQGILRHKCPLLYATAADEDCLKSLEWKNMRGRLSQNESTTQGRNWLEKMQYLLLNKLNKGKGKKDQFVLSDTGDLQLKDSAQPPVTGLINLIDEPGDDSDNNDQVDDDEGEETDKGTGKQGLAVIATGTPFSSSKLPFTRSKTGSTPSETVSSAGSKRNIKTVHRDPPNKKAKVAYDGNNDSDSDTERFSPSWDLSNKSLDSCNDRRT